MPPTVPTATVRIAGEGREVRFTMATLLRIEQTAGMGIYEIVHRFQELRPERRVLDGRELSDAELAKLADADRNRLEPSAAAKAESLKRFRLGLVAGFSAGCLGMTVEAYAETVPPADMLDVLGELQDGFIEAVGQLNGVGDDEAVPTTPSEPRPTSASSSACGDGSSPN